MSYKGTCHVILLAKLHDMYLYKTDNFFHINHYLKSVSKVALLHRFYCNVKQFRPRSDPAQRGVWSGAHCVPTTIVSPYFTPVQFIFYGPLWSLKQFREIWKLILGSRMRPYWPKWASLALKIETLAIFIFMCQDLVNPFRIDWHLSQTDNPKEAVWSGPALPIIDWLQYLVTKYFSYNL